MDRFISKNVLFVTAVVFAVVILLQIITTILQTKQEQYKIVQKHTKILSDYYMINRHYYQKLYANGVIPLTEDTLKGLPAYSSSIVSKEFSDANEAHVTIRTVSDIPRNPKNRADKYELEAIKSFKAHKEKKEYFKEYDDFYQYALVLRIEPICLKCHGKRSDAPRFIQDRYDQAYGYKLGDIRGVLSIKVPKEQIAQYFNKLTLFSIVKNLLLLMVLFILILYISRKNRNFHKILENLVNQKTKKLQEKEKQILYLSQHDELTGLANRLCLKEDIKRYKAAKLAYINIDDFKNINDFYGIKAGDKILKEYASYLKKVADAFGLDIYKLPSDEFALFCKRDSDDEQFLKNIKKILNKLNTKKFKIGSQEISLTSTVGVCFEKTQIMGKTDIALKKAKRENIDIGVYDKSDNIEKQIKHNFNIVNKIKYAKENDKIVPFFQPIYSLKNKSVLKYESLARIIDKDNSIITPYSFIDIAKKSKLYTCITKSMIKKTFELASKYPDISFSINLSPIDMQDDKTIAYIEESLKNLKNPDKIIFEILESESIKNYQCINGFITHFKDFGCKFSIDDFGSGYSNFSHLIELNIDFLKIDGSLIKNINKDKKTFETIKAIVSFANTLNIKTVAEFVESEEILYRIDKIDIDFAQGYYIGKPMQNLVKEPKIIT